MGERLQYSHARYTRKCEKHTPPHKLIYNMTNKFHVLPINDTREHQENGVVCECRPEIRVEDEENCHSQRMGWERVERISKWNELLIMKLSQNFKEKIFQDAVKQLEGKVLIVEEKKIRNRTLDELYTQIGKLYNPYEGDEKTKIEHALLDEISDLITSLKY